ncbi:hypothetical protein LU196_11645 [Pantoea sp. Mb-10]|uniref:hypothetical protein n=1 Tax=unclassified Pantoea TaxID=2630326 RepID=UPI001E32D7B8|nr:MULTISPECIES: hypothetical protein [unclassified Pantoea]MCE0490700.1 hypothetical protein [Pantoea sp. Mb-10]MCE0500142.1 hypothetical protein [Pantoea sp. Pb-8]
MNQDEKQKLIDEIIGEATLALLERAGPVNTSALIEQLNAMHTQASDETQREAISAAIKEVHHSLSSGQKTREKQGSSDNVHQLFTHSPQTDGRKH